MATLAVPEAKIHYQCMGEGPYLVLVHGLGANLAFWYMGLARAFSSDYTIVAYDLRGHGRSTASRSGYTLPEMAADLARLLDHLGVDKAHLVGHSYGARVALAHAIANPDRLLTLTVADTQVRSVQPQTRLRDWPHWPVWKRQLTEMGHSSLPDDEEVITFELLARFNQLSNSFTSGSLQRTKRAPSLKRRDMGARGAARWKSLLTTTDAREELADETGLVPARIKTIETPTLAIYGEFSHCLESGHRLNEIIPDCELSIVPGAGHFHPAVKPRRFAAELRRFLAAHDDREGLTERGDRGRAARARRRAARVRGIPR